MAGTEYTLTGFDGFSERYRVVFVDPLPSTRVCGICGLVPSHSVVLPCGHAFCQVCKDQISKEDGKCPLDDVQFADDDVVIIPFKESSLEQLRVLCVAGANECSFAGKLCDLEKHLDGCGSDKVRCAKCKQSVVRSVAVEHYRQCFAEAPPRHSASVKAISRAAVKLAEMKKDLKRVKEWVSSGDVDRDTVVNAVNSLMELVASLVRDLINPEEEVCFAKCGSSQSDIKKTAVSTGPFRAASKLGAFITTCDFYNIYHCYKSLTESKKEEILIEDCNTLAGYTFDLECKLQKNGAEHVALSFLLFLTSGDWNDSVKWPFAKKVTIILAHPRHEAKDIRLPILMEAPEMVKNPGNSANCGSWSKTVNCVDLELQGFFVNNRLCIHVEFK